MSQVLSTYEQQAIDFLNLTGTTFAAEFKAFDLYFSDDKQPRNIFEITLQNTSHKYRFKFGSSIADSCKEVTRPKINGDGDINVYYGFKHNLKVKGSVSFGHLIKTTIETLRAIDKGEINADTLINEIELSKNFISYRNEVDEYNAKRPAYDRIIGEKNTDVIEAKIRASISNKINQLKEETETVLLGQKDEIIVPSAYDVLACIEKYEVTYFEDFCSNYGYDTDSRKAYKTYKAVKREWENVKKLFSEDQLELLREIQ